MRWITAIILTVAFAMTSAVQAAPGKGKGAAKTSTVTGTVVGYQEHKQKKNLVISVPNDDGKTEEKTIKLDDSTKVTLDGQTVAASALRAGEKVTITLARKVASQVTATSH
jgi:hypothetical protein